MLPALVPLRAALTGVVSPSAPPPRPWLTWLLVALCRQRARQDWVVHIANTHLATVEDFEGRVPGHPLWSFCFHGDGLCLAGPNREVVDVEIGPDRDQAHTIDPYFFVGWLLSFERPARVEARAVDWLGASRPLLIAALDVLRTEGVLVHPTSNHVFRLHPWLEEHYVAIAGVDFEHEAMDAAWRSALGGARDNERSLGAFHDWLTSLLADRKQARVIDGLQNLLPAHDVVDACRALMRGPVDYVTGRSVRVLRQMGEVPGVDATELLERLDPTTQNPYTAVELAEWWFEHEQIERAVEVIGRFSAQRQITGFRGNPQDYAYAELALRFVPDQALPFVRRALRSRVPSSFEKTAALLSVLDEAWCRAELLEAATDAIDPISRRFLVGCLVYSEDASTRRQAMDLMPDPPERRPDQVGYTAEEVAYAMLRSGVERQRGRALDAAARLRPH